MKNKTLLFPVLLITLVTGATWIATDRHSYTKYEVVENVQVPLDSDDPLAGTGFYDDETVEKTIRRAEFHLGLLPTPQGLIDKHMLSVTSLLAAVWGPYLLLLFWNHRRWGKILRHRLATPLAQTRNQEHGGKRE